MRLVTVSYQSKQSGITSIMVVIFAALLLSVITLSFAYLMNNEAQRSSDDDLSQSAYDSAMAGVEDAKRTIMLANSGNSTAQGAIAAGECNTVAAAGVTGDPDADETVIQSTISGAGLSMNQAYTCVTISMDSPDYESSLDEMRSILVPLRGERPVASVELEWHEATTSLLSYGCGVDPIDTATPLCQKNDWGDPASTPALLRAQFITPGSGITHGELDGNSGGQTVFLYPKGIGSNSYDLDNFDRYVSRTAGNDNELKRAICSPTPPVQGYHCSVNIDLRSAIATRSQTDFLRLTAIYNSTDFRVTLRDASGRPVDFVGVQPVVDSTGRANDLFRRVEARLSLTAEADYPEFAVDLDSSLCKDFYVTSNSSGRTTLGCAP